MTNNVDINTIIGYGRRSDGTLENIGTFATGGKGAIIDEPDGIDPLFSGFSVITTPDNRLVIAVNAGSRSITVFRVMGNFRLRLVSTGRVSGSGPVSVAFSHGVVYAASVESARSLDPDAPPFSLEGRLTGFRLRRSGRLSRLGGSVRRLSNRPSAIQFTKDGSSLVVTSVAAGSTDLDSTGVDEISVFRVMANGRLSSAPIDTATSTLPNNSEGRSLPGAIGFHTVRVDGTQYAVVPEPRFIDASGSGVTQQVSSISTWRIDSNQNLIPMQTDLLIGSSKSGQEATCWIEFSRSQDYFWVANTVSGTLSAFSFNDGIATLVQEVAGSAAIPIDLWLSSDGKFLYQLSNGAVDVFEVENNGFGPGLTNIQTLTDVPATNVQGIVAI